MTWARPLTHEIEGSHVQIGVDLARRYKENELVVHAIAAHHGDIEPQTIVACPGSGSRCHLRRSSRRTP